MDPRILRRSYDRFAERYDAIFTHQQTPKITALFGALPRPLGTPVADLGCGTGLVTRITRLAVVGVDVSGHMLRRAALEWRVQAELSRLPLAASAFGLVFAVTSLLDFEPEVPAAAEIARVLRPGGHLALSVLKSENIPALEGALRREGLEPLRRLDLELDLGFICRRL